MKVNPRVLLVEDNEQNRYLVTVLLEHHGCALLSAATGPAALKIAGREPIDLILLDIQLPGMDGYAVARHLRTYDSLASVPIVALTSYAMVGDRERVLAAGCDGYLEKPIDPATFFDQLEPFLAKSWKRP